MKSVAKVLVLVGSIVLGLTCASAATVSGVVKGPDGSPFRGAIVQAEHLETKITVHVFSDSQGHYKLDGLLPGQFRVQARAVGFKTENRDGVSLTADQNASFDFSLQKGAVRWSDLSMYEGRTLLPADPEKERLTTTCYGCHGFETRMAAVQRDESGWLDRVNFMRTSESFALQRKGSPDFISDDEAQRLASYLAKMFGPDSDIAKSPADLPEYAKVKATEPPFTDEALKLVYVSYPVGGNYFPGNGQPEKDGFVYSWEIAKHQFAKVNPKTGEVQQIQVPPDPESGIAFVHSVRMAPDGTLWYTKRAGNAIAKYDPKTQKVTEYNADRPGYKHTLVVDKHGIVWVSGAPLSSFDPETGKYTYYEEVKNAYGVDVDKDGNAWFSEPRTGLIGKVDGNTHKVSTFMPPSAKLNGLDEGRTGLPDERYTNQARRLKVADDGMIWFGEYGQGKLGSFDPKTEKFKEYQLPGPWPTPYALTIDKKNHVWYASYETDTVGELDPSSGKIVRYPFIYSENQMRDFATDDDDRVWWGSHTNNRVGYFYIAGPNAPKQAFAGYTPKTAQK